jgi:hypothetical protein
MRHAEPRRGIVRPLTIARATKAPTVRFRIIVSINGHVAIQPPDLPFHFVYYREKLPKLIECLETEIGRAQKKKRGVRVPNALGDGLYPVDSVRELAMTLYFCALVNSVGGRA